MLLLHLQRLFADWTGVPRLKPLFNAISMILVLAGEFDILVARAELGVAYHTGAAGETCLA